ncbi:hypothetical protein [Xanthobacter flavus]|uniref:hypothetical protein n=1 Tax=Xanthobacter flavus TaxID=281 RepID=UPI00372C1AC4
MNEALARARRLAEQLAEAATLAGEIVAEMADVESRCRLDPDEVRKKELHMFRRASDEAMQFLLPGQRLKNLRFARDELEAISMYSREEDIRGQARDMVEKCDAELSKRVRRKKKARGKLKAGRA